MKTPSSVPLVSVKGNSPPEELLALNAGPCGLWQICVVCITSISVLFHGFDIFSSKISTPYTLNYTCAAENSSQCFYGNGTRCRKFNFSIESDRNVRTYMEKFELVCEYEHWDDWITNCFRAGMTVGCYVTGWAADRFGQKITGMLFIPMQCLLGIFLISITNFSMMLFFAFIQGLCSTYIYVIPRVAVCEAVGNKWRTLMMGFSALPLSISLLLSPLLYLGFYDINRVVAIVSVMPLILLVPILYFKDSPNKILTAYDFKKGEDAIRRIAQFNKHPMPSDIRIRPVKLIDIAPPKKNLCPSLIWKYPETRKVFLANYIINFFMGISFNLNFYYIYYDYKYLYAFGTSAIVGSILGIILCQFFKNKIIIGIFLFLNDLTLFAIFLAADLQVIKLESYLIFALKIIATFFLFVMVMAVAIIGPRLFPTEFRAEGTAVTISIFYVGCFLSTILLHATHTIFWGVPVTLIILSPVFGFVSCFWLYEVHNRELPDFLEDAVNYKKYYKPVRYVSIQDKYATMHETEVRTIELNPTDFLRKK